MCDNDNKCVPYYLCDPKNKVTTDGWLLIDERFSVETPKKDLPICETLKTCCEKPKFISEIPTCDEFETPAKCGKRNPDGLGGNSKSLQGVSEFSNYAEFPWMMAVMNKTLHLLGGGSLITPKIVLTAAHIIADTSIKDLIVRGGEYNTQTVEEMCKHEDMKVQNVIRHENFLRRNLQNNLALLVTHQPFKLTSFINTICLPPRHMKFVGQRCLSSGWGKKFFNKNDLYQVYMKKVELPVVASAKCQDQLRKTQLGEDFILDEGFLCAGRKSN